MFPFGNSESDHLERNDEESQLIIYPSTCRICLKSSQDLTSLFVFTKQECMASSEKINYFVDLHILQDDGFPQKICKSCENELEISLCFKKKCIESYNRLCQYKCENRYIKLEREEEAIKDEDNASFNSFRSDDDEESPEKCMKIKKKRLKKHTESNSKELSKLQKKNRNVLLSKLKDSSKSGVEDSELEASYVSQDGSHQCKSCGKLVSTKAAMINHFKSHSGPMNCPACNKRFPSKKLCTRHYKNVHLAYTETCPVCGRAFKLLATLQTHMKTHSASKPFSCQHCGRSFLNKHNMLMHVRSHLQLKEFCCHLCGMAFITPGALRFHTIRKHSKVRPFPCSFDGCSLSFAANSELARHETTHTATRKHTCPLCHKGFKRTDVYSKHMRKQHAEPEERTKVKFREMD